MSSEPKTTSRTLGPEGGFCDGFKAGVEGVEVMEATSGAIGLVTTRRGAVGTCVWGREELGPGCRIGLARREGTWVMEICHFGPGDFPVSPYTFDPRTRPKSDQCCRDLLRLDQYHSDDERAHHCVPIMAVH